MRVGIALGSNLGDRMAHLRNALSAIQKVAEPPILISFVYETEPVDCPEGSPAFLNAAVEIGYSGDIHRLFRQLQDIEQTEGRPLLRDRNAPRPLDLDLLYVDDLVLDSPTLKLPHPRLMERAFVLRALVDIVPNRKLPQSQITFSDRLNSQNIDQINRFKYTLHQ